MATNNYFDVALQAEGLTGPLADFAKSIFKQESSGGKNTQTSNAGAVGGMQIIPSTFNSVADKGWDISNPYHNARAGIRYIKNMNKLAGGDLKLTAAGYYGGPGAINKARKGIAVSDPRNPHAPNTLQYGEQVVARIMGKAPAVHAPVKAERSVVPTQGQLTTPAIQQPQQPEQQQSLPVPEFSFTAVHPTQSVSYETTQTPTFSQAPQEQVVQVVEDNPLPTFAGVNPFAMSAVTPQSLNFWQRPKTKLGVFTGWGGV